MHQDTTEHLGLPLPHPNNRLQDDVLHLREAMHGIDRALYQHSQATTALGESVQDITPEITAQLQAQTQALGSQMQAGTQTVTDAVAAQAQDITQAMGAELTAQAQALAGDIATRASAQQLQAAFTAQGQFIGKSISINLFQSVTWAAPCDGVVSFVALGAGGGGGTGEKAGTTINYGLGGTGGYSGGWGLKNMRLKKGDVLNITIGAGGGSNTAGGNTVVTCGAENYIAYGGPGGVLKPEPYVALPDGPMPSDNFDIRVRSVKPYDETPREPSGGAGVDIFAMGNNASASTNQGGGSVDQRLGQDWLNNFFGGNVGAKANGLGGNQGESGSGFGNNGYPGAVGGFGAGGGAGGNGVEGAYASDFRGGAGGGGGVGGLGAGGGGGAGGAKDNGTGGTGGTGGNGFVHLQFFADVGV